MRDKERTKREILEALEAVLVEEGYERVGINHVAKRSCHAKELIYRYFGSLDGLMTELFFEKDYWMRAMADVRLDRLEDNPAQLRDVAVALLQNQFIDYFEDPLQRELIAYSISRARKPTKRLFSEAREAAAEPLLRLTDRYFAGKGVPFRGISSFFVGGTYYASLHASRNKGRVCRLDLNASQVQDQMLTTIKRVMHGLFHN